MTKSLSFLFLFISSLFLEAQISDTAFTTPPMIASNSGRDNYTVQVSSTVPLKIVGALLDLNVNTDIEIWYRVGGVLHPSASTPEVTTANGWQVVLLNGSVSDGTANVYAPVVDTFSIPVNPGTPVGICFRGRLRYRNGSYTQDNFTDVNGFFTIENGPGKSFSGAAATWPVINFSSYTACNLIYELSEDCVSPPVAGTTNATQNPICLSETTDLFLSGAEFANLQTIQWQSSTDGNTWTDIPGETKPRANNISASEDTYFRCQITCNGVSATSIPVLVESTGAPLSGTYTINPASPPSTTNFQSFNALTDAWNCGGISGPVTVNVSNGTYTEKVIFKELLGASDATPITINGNGSILEYEATGNNDRPTLVFDGADWVTIDDLHVRTVFSAATGWALHMHNGANHNTFTNCIFETNPVATTIAYMGIVTSSTPTAFGTTADASGTRSASYTTFKDNTIIGGYQGITLSGLTTIQEVGNIISNNEIRDFYHNGIMVNAQDSLQIIHNDIHRPFSLSSHGTLTAINFTGGGLGNRNITNAQIVSNRVHDLFTLQSSSTATTRAFSFSNAAALGDKANLLANNLVYDINHLGTIEVIYFGGNGSPHWNVYHNTIVIDDPSSSATSHTRLLNTPITPAFRPGQIPGPAQDSIVVKNNLFWLDRGLTSPQHIFHYGTDTSKIEVDNNAYYAPRIANSNVYLGYWGANVETLADWKSGNGGLHDQHARFTEIAFEDPIQGNYTPTSPGINNMGADLQQWVPFDVDSIARDNYPDPGAYEFTPTEGSDMTILSFVKPAGGSCAGTLDIDVEVSNLGTDTVSTLYFSWYVDGNPEGTSSVNGQFLSGTTTIVTVGTFTMPASGTIDIEVIIDSIGPDIDFDPSNNALTLEDFKPGLSGNYTINQGSATSGTNFSSFTEFAEEISLYGVCGPVVVDVVSGSGTYTEQVLFGNIANASATNTITINGNGNELYNQTTTFFNRSTLALNGTRHLIIDSLNITAGATDISEYGWAIHAFGGLSYNTIRNCEIKSNIGGMNANYGGIIFSGSPSSFAEGVTGRNNVIENNTIIGGDYGILLLNQTPSSSGIITYGTHNAIRNNTIENFNSRGIEASNQLHLEISGNVLHRADRATVSAMRGISLLNRILHGVVSGNTIRNSASSVTSSTAIQTGIYIDGSGADTAKSLLANNFIYELDGFGSIVGIDLGTPTTNFWNIYHNTVAIESPNVLASGYIRGMAINGGTDVDIRNNIVTINGTNTPSHCFYIGNSFSGQLDYNGFYVPLGGQLHVGRQSSTDYSQLSDWQNQGYETNGIFAKPIYQNIANAEYRPGTIAFDGVGDDLLTIVPEDFEGITRTSSPDLGALEYDPAPCAGPVNLVLDSMTDVSAFLSWVSNESSWEIEWGMLGFSPGSGTGTIVSPISSNESYELTALVPDTCIDIYVRDLCGSDTSEWSLHLRLCTSFDYDVQPSKLISPEDYLCGDSSMTIIFAIQNNGFMTASNFDVGVRAIAPDGQSQSISTTYSGSLQQDEQDTVQVTIDALLGGVYELRLFTDFSQDNNSDNDTLSSSLVVNDAGKLNILSSHDTICDTEDVMLSIDPLQLGNFVWLDLMTNDTLSTADTLELLNVNQTTNIRVVTIPGKPDQAVGPKDITIGTAFNVTVAASQLANNSLTFEIFEETVLRSIKVYPQNAGNLDIIVRNASTNAIVHTALVSIPTGGGLPARVELNFPLGSGEYTLGARSQNSTIGGLLRNQNGAAYPYVLPGVASITGTSYPNQNIYWCYYDFVFGSGSCPRPDTEFTIVKLESPIASFTDNHAVVTADTSGFEVNFDASSSSDGLHYAWDFGDGNTGSGDTTTHTYTQNGTYEVQLIVSNNCGSDTISESIVVTGIAVDKFSSNLGDILIYPNPNNGLFTIQISQTNAEDVRIEFIDMMGKNIYTDMLKAFEGKYSREYDMQKLSAGVYMVRIISGGNIATRKIIVKN